MKEQKDGSFKQLVIMIVVINVLSLIILVMGEVGGLWAPLITLIVFIISRKSDDKA